MGLYRDNGKEDGNYYLGFRVQGLGFRIWGLALRTWGLELWLSGSQGYSQGIVLFKSTEDVSAWYIVWIWHKHEKQTAME